MPQPNGNEVYLNKAQYNSDEISGFLEKEMDCMLFKSPWCKLFRTDIIKSNHIRFDENISFGEDSVFMLQYLSLCNTIVTVDNCDYRYFIPQFTKYIITHQNFRYTLKRKVEEFNKLKKQKNINNTSYLTTEIHSLLSRLLASEINRKYTFRGYKDFKYTCMQPEIKYIDIHKGGRLFRLVTSLMQSKIIWLAFFILRFVYPLTLLNTNRQI